MLFSILIVLSFFIGYGNVAAMQQTKYIPLIQLPGVGGGGNTNGSALGTKVIDGSGVKLVAIKNINHSEADLGQDRCVGHFEEQVKNIFNTNEQLIMVGASQGGATLINFLSKKEPQEQQKVKALFLEGVLANPNNAIMHFVRNNSLFFPAAYLPFSRVWLPWAVKAFMFKNYKPNGMKAINAVKNLKKDLPVILMHAQRDPEISINDARSMYIEMKNNGMNPYLIEIDSNNHTDNLATNEGRVHKINHGTDVILISGFLTSNKDVLQLALQKACKEFNVPLINKQTVTMSCQDGIHSIELNDDDLLQQIQLDAYQPDPQEVQKKIDQSKRKERLMHTIIDVTTLTTCMVGVGAYLYKKIFR